MTTMEVIENYKGDQKLLHEGIRWECFKMASFSCKGAVTTDIDMQTVIVIRIVPHTHDPNPDSVTTSRLKSTTKNKSGTSRGMPTQILVKTTVTALCMHFYPTRANPCMKNCYNRSRKSVRSWVFNQIHRLWSPTLSWPSSILLVQCSAHTPKDTAASITCRRTCGGRFSLGLVHLYRENSNVKNFCAMLDGLASLPIRDVVSRIQYLRENTPDGLEPPIDYFDSTYISGQFRSIQLPTQSDGTIPSIRMWRLPPTFAPELWNVHDITLLNGPGTNSTCEGWNNAFAKLIRHAHPTICHDLVCHKQSSKRPGNGIHLLLWDNRGDPPAKCARHNMSNYNPSSWIYAQPAETVLSQWRISATASDGSKCDLINCDLCKCMKFYPTK